MMAITTNSSTNVKPTRPRIATRPTDPRFVAILARICLPFSAELFVYFCIAKKRAAVNKMLLKQPVSASFETLEGLLIFLDLFTSGLPDSRKSSDNAVFPTQSKPLTHSATEKSTSP
jgi:hypothetical protein